jgi:hypothetical protein
MERSTTAVTAALVCLEVEGRSFGISRKPARDYAASTAIGVPTSGTITYDVSFFPPTARR